MSNHRTDNRFYAKGGRMKRLWIWSIPILAAVSTIWLQAVIHEDNRGAATNLPLMPLEQYDTAAYKPHVTDDPDDRIPFPPLMSDPPH